MPASGAEVREEREAGGVYPGGRCIRGVHTRVVYQGEGYLGGIPGYIPGDTSLRTMGGIYTTLRTMGGIYTTLGYAGCTIPHLRVCWVYYTSP